jgi:hypothetical protein
MASKISPPAVTVDDISYTVALNASGSTITFNKPAGTEEGDLLLITVRNAVYFWEAPAGWTTLSINENPASPLELVAYKIAGSSEPSTYTFTRGSTSFTNCGVLLNVKAASFSAFSRGDRVASTICTAPSVTSGGTGVLIVGFVTNGSITLTSGTPSGLTAISTELGPHSPIDFLTMHP